MAEVAITHPFVSTKSESPDNTIVSKNEWNDRLNMSGGLNGQLVMADSTQTHGAKWVNGPAGLNNSANYSGGNLSGALASIAVVKNTNVFLLAIVTFGGTLASGTTCTVSLYRNAVQFRTQTVQADGIFRPLVYLFSDTTGTDNYSVVVSTAGPNVTSSTVNLDILVLGIY